MRVFTGKAPGVFCTFRWKEMAATETSSCLDGMWKRSWKLIAANLAGDPSPGRLHFDDHLLRAKEYVFYDQLHGVPYVWSSDEIRNLDLFVGREGAHLFDISRARGIPSDLTPL